MKENIKGILCLLGVALLAALLVFKVVIDFFNVRFFLLPPTSNT